MNRQGAQSLSARSATLPAEGRRARLGEAIAAAMAAAGGWLPFDRFMSMALYEPGLGYYAHGATLFGSLPASGSDFVTAPELSPLFGAVVARQVAQFLEAAGAADVLEFGAGSGALAEQMLDELGARVARYAIVEISGPLRARQRERLARFGQQVVWLDAWPERIEGAVVGNEVLDAMPVQLLRFDGQDWHERGVVREGEGFGWADRPTALRPPVPGPFVPGTVTEIHPQAEAFVRTLAARLVRGAALFIDYGFPESEYYLAQRHMGTLMCHRAHRADVDPLVDVGEKDITAHVNFSGVALAAQAAGLDVIGYTSQARFLMNAGLLERLSGPGGVDPRLVAPAQKLLGEHEMGELFKVIAFARGIDVAPLGFAAGDRLHAL